MPSVNLQLTPAGPLIDVLIHVSEPRAQALAAVNQPIPQAVSARLLIDTGASNTSVDPSVIVSLGLQPTGTVLMHTPSTAGAPILCEQYDIKLVIPHASLHGTFGAIAVIASEFLTQGFHGLLGRDILSQCVLIYNGEIGFYTLSF
jgi:predicted aspartyl protease